MKIYDEIETIEASSKKLLQQRITDWHLEMREQMIRETFLFEIDEIKFGKENNLHTAEIHYKTSRKD